MEELGIGILFAMLGWGPPLLALLVVTVVLWTRIDRLERQLRERMVAPPVPAQTRPIPAPAPADTAAPPADTIVPVADRVPTDGPEPSDAPPPPPPTPPPAPIRRPPPRAPTPLVLPSPERVVVWLAAGLGGFALLLTALFALVTVVERGWLGPSARVAMGLAGGTGAWVVGSGMRRRWPWVGSALSGAGIGTLYGTLYAGASRFEVIPSAVASVGMFAITALAMARATVDRDRFVAWLALIGGLLTPWLVSTGENRPFALFLYLTLLASGVLLAARRRGWPDLVIGTAVGVAAVHVGWSAAWWTAEQVPAALVGVLLLVLPFAVAATSRTPAVRIAATAATAVLPLLALPWIVPVEATFSDPRSGLFSVRTEPLAEPLAALFTALLPLPLVLLGRWHRQRLQAGVTLLTAGLLSTWFAVAWMANGTGSAWTVVGLVAGLVAAAIIALGDEETSLGIGAWPALAGFLLSAVVLFVPPGALGVGIVLLAASAAVLSASSGWGGLVGVGLLGVAVAAWASSVNVEHGVGYVVGPALVVLGLSHGALRRTWDDGAPLAWSAAALAPVALFPPLYRGWLAGFGDTVVGLLPVLLGLWALLGVRVLVRRRLVGTNDLAVAAFAFTVLLGVSAAVPLQLEQRWLTVAWAIEAAALAWASRRIGHPLVRVASFVLCVVVGFRLLANPWALGWGDAGEGWVVLNWTLYTWGIPLVCVLLCARWLPRPPPDPFGWVALPLGLLATFIGFALVNVEVSHAFQDRGALELASADRLQSMVRSGSWAAWGLLVLGIGLWRDHRVIRLVGFGFVMLATVKVFAFDLWGLQGFVRVGSLGCLALSLILAAFAFERLVLRGARAPRVTE